MNRAFYLTCIIVACFFGIVAFQLDLYSAGEVFAGFFPLVLSILLCFTSAFCLFWIPNLEKLFESKKYTGLVVLALTVVFLFGVNIVGLYLSSIVYLLLLFLYLGYRKIPYAFLAISLWLVVSFVVFEKFLGIQVP